MYFFALCLLALDSILASPHNVRRETTSSSGRRSLRIRPISAEVAASRRFDVILVGGGATGCPLARTLADGGKSVLVIERGPPRTEHPQSLDIYGAGVVINNPEATQAVITEEGVRSHIGAVLSGGSAVNMGIIINDDAAYLDYLEENFKGVKFDRALLANATRWTEGWATHPMPETLPYGRRWKEGLEKVFGPNVGYSPNLKINRSWQAASLFDSDNNWFRVGSDVSLGIPGKDFPKNLNVLVKHTVHRVLFEPGKRSGSLRATCVEFAPTSLEDIAPIGSHLPPSTAETISYRVSQALNIRTFRSKVPSRYLHRVCVKPNGGQIILSAGAILTPILLFKSGVGSRQDVLNSGAEMVREIPLLGKNMKDRVFIPLGIFFKDELPASGFPPRICQNVAIGNVGPHCHNFKMGDRNMGCSTVPAEELSGGRIAEGTIYATRYIVPPLFRHDPFFEAIFNILSSCGDNTAPFGKVFFKSLCPIARPIINCFRKVAANLYFTSVPKSTGRMEVMANGEIAITGNYLQDPQDLEDAMRGVAHIIEVVNSDIYDGILEPAGLNSCPATILNGVLSFIDNQFVKTSDIVGMSTSNVTADEMRKFLSDRLTDFEQQNALYNAFNFSAVSGFNFNESEAATAPLSTDVKEMEGASFRIFGNRSSRRYWTSQKFATYPPAIPEPTDPTGLAQFAKTWMTSMWHWVGSAAMGDITDSNFLVKGFDNLRIVDASVLPQLTRMNPLLFVLSLGRYAGLLILRNLEEQGNLAPGAAAFVASLQNTSHNDTIIAPPL